MLLFLRFIVPPASYLGDYLGIETVLEREYHRFEHKTSVETPVLSALTPPFLPKPGIKRDLHLRACFSPPDGNIHHHRGFTGVLSRN